MCINIIRDFMIWNKKIIKVILLIFLLNCILLKADANDEKIINIADQFFDSLKQENTQKLSRVLMDNIIIKRVAYKDLRILIKKFMAKKISVLTYIKTITGNNLYKIFYGFTYKNGKEKLSIKDYEIIYPIRTGEKIVKEGLKDNFYYVNVKVTFNKLIFKGDSKIPERIEEENKVIEIDIMQDNDREFKVFGFII